MSEFGLQVKQVVIRLLKDNDFEVRTDSDQNHSMVVNSVGRVCVLPPYIALYDFRQGMVGLVDVAEPDSLEQFLVMIKSHRDLVKLGINRSRQALMV